MRVAAISTGHGLGLMRTSLNATALAGSINGVTGLLGKAGLLGAALAVGVAIGTWLDSTFGLSEKLTELISKLTGLDGELNKHGKRYKTRAEAFGSFLPTQPRMFNAVPVASGGRYDFDVMADANANAPMSVSPQVIGHGSSAREIASALAVELQSRQTVDVNVTASPGTQADVKQQQPSTGSRTRLKLPASGSPR